ncbi:MAG: hypothetical protein GOU98_02230 [Candidatus Altiarchaeota archaeon]|nr:hypothetical protein [Candidatus Altiarchaeota archaeon]
MIFLKVDGKILTKKRQFTVDWTGLNTVVESIDELGEETIIGHGGGSFSETIQTEYKGVREGFFKIREAMNKLNALFTSSLIAKGIDAISFSPSAFCISKGEKIQKMFYEPIVDSLKNYVPVIHSGAVLDRETIYKVYSVDELFYVLAQHIKPRKFLVASDSAIEVDNEMVKEIADWNFRDVIKGVGEEKKQQIMDAAKISSRHQLEVNIFDGSVPGAIKRAWKFGEGTRIRVTRIPKSLD